MIYILHGAINVFFFLFFLCFYLQLQSKDQPYFFNKWEGKKSILTFRHVQTITYLILSVL